jgi:outer membrane protein assembly factor BamB
MLSLLFVMFSGAAPGDWHQWRGPSRDGVSTETGLLQEWPQDGPKLLWETKGAGRGYSSLAIAGGKIYTLGDGLSTVDDKDEYAICFDDGTGKEIWKTKLGPAWTQGQASWQSSRSTPTLHGDKIYYMTPSGVLHCLSSADGKQLWKKSMKEDFKGGADMWGYSESPLIDGDNVIVTPGKVDHTMVALNKNTGEVVWSCKVEGNKGAGHSSIVISTIGSNKVYVQTSQSHIMGVRAGDGKLLWTSPIGAISVIPTPIIKGDLVLAAAGYGKGATLLKQSPDGDGIKVEKLYDYKKELCNKHGGIVLVGDYLYGCADDKNQIYCAKLSTGEVEEGWKKRGSGKGSIAITAADGHLYARYSDGTMTLVKASPGSFQEVSKFTIPHSGDRPSWSHPVILNGKLYLREGDHVLCYEIKK